MALEDAANEIDVAFTRENLRGLAYENPFSGVPSFLRRKLTKKLEGVDLAVTGIAFDQSVTNRPGTRFGPRAIREASTGLAGDCLEKPHLSERRCDRVFIGGVVEFAETGEVCVRGDYK